MKEFQQEDECTLILPDFTTLQVNQVLAMLYGQVEEIKDPGEIFKVLGLFPFNKLRAVNARDQEIKIDGIDVELQVGVCGHYKLAF